MSFVGFDFIEKYWLSTYFIPGYLLGSQVQEMHNYAFRLHGTRRLTEDTEMQRTLVPSSEGKKQMRK